jgi:hypothetical protein
LERLCQFHRNRTTGAGEKWRTGFLRLFFPGAFVPAISSAQQSSIPQQGINVPRAVIRINMETNQFFNHAKIGQQRGKKKIKFEKPPNLLSDLNDLNV